MFGFSSPLLYLFLSDVALRAVGLEESELEGSLAWYIEEEAELAMR